ncbi:hypothetical protein CG708_25690, partial [Salmonella enterica subsp. enterica serovar Typhimurium]
QRKHCIECSAATIHGTGNTGNHMGGSMPDTTNFLTGVIIRGTSLVRMVYRFMTPFSGEDFVLYGGDTRCFA